MSTQHDGFNDAIFGQLSQLGIEILNDSSGDEIDNSLSRAIYEMTKDTSTDNNDS